MTRIEAQVRCSARVLAPHRLVDGIELQLNGAWPDPDAAAAALGVVRRTGATTPLTGYDIDMDGPFGDADPSVYL